MEACRQATEEEIDYAYKVIEAVVEGASRVDATPRLAQAYLLNLVSKLPDVTDALLAITIPEHRMKVVELVRAVTRALVVLRKSR